MLIAVCNLAAVSSLLLPCGRDGRAEVLVRCRRRAAAHPVPRSPSRRSPSPVSGRPRCHPAVGAGLAVRVRLRRLVGERRVAIWSQQTGAGGGPGFGLVLRRAGRWTCSFAGGAL
ncbi:hypothetical protein HBB16_03285 [Pseudonocardia sp. MCCB 268]|nr:hypothetical protein [Pseudonocardia cytotoxica]